MTRVPVHALCATVAALAILSVACGGSGPQQASPIAPTQTSPPAAPDPPGTVRGRTIDHSTGLPVEGITVGFGSLSTVSGSAGVYSLTVPPGAYTPTINGANIGSAVVTESQYLGDLLVNGGSCVARYGMTEDATTRMPLEGVVVSGWSWLLSDPMSARRAAAILLPVAALLCSSLLAVPRAGGALPEHECTVTANNFAFSPSRIEVRQNEIVRVAFHAIDIPHTFTIDEYRISKRAAIGQTIVFEFRADRAGTFPIYCNLTADERCRRMKAALVVTP